MAAFAFPAGALTETSPDKRIFIHNSFCNTWHSFNARRSNAPAFRGQKHDCLGLELSGEKKGGVCGKERDDSFSGESQTHTGNLKMKGEEEKLF